MDKDIEILKYALKPEPFIVDILGLQCKDFHKEWLDMIESSDFVSFQAPRDHGKTFMIGAYIIWRIVTDPNIRILIVTINQDKADEMMTFIQHHLERNETLKQIFGEQRGWSREWSRSTLRVMRAGSTGIAHKEPTLSVFGITASMIGGHYELIVLDDIIDQKNTGTPLQRKKVESWYNNTLKPMKVPKKGKIVCIGTRWHENDFHNFIANIPGYISKRYQAIINDETKEVLWPERYSYEELQKIKSQGMVSFELQYQNNIISTGESPIKMDWIQLAMSEYKNIIPPYETFMGVDLASKGEDSDYFTITVIGIKDGCVYVLDGIRTHASMFHQFELIKSFDEKWHPSKIGIEAGAQQKIITDQFMEMSTLPIFPIKSSSVYGKDIRVQRLSVLFETNRILINPILASWADELIMYPRGMYDDTIDSLSFAIQSSQLENEKKIDWMEVKNMLSSTKETIIKKSSDVNKFYKIVKI